VHLGRQIGLGYDGGVRESSLICTFGLSIIAERCKSVCHGVLKGSVLVSAAAKSGSKKGDAFRDPAKVLALVRHPEIDFGHEGETHSVVISAKDRRKLVKPGADHIVRVFLVKLPQECHCLGIVLWDIQLRHRM
jgi:hypothetical protein